MPASAPIHAVLGTDDVEVKRVARELATTLAGAGEFGTEIIDGEVDDSGEAAHRVNQAIEALNTFGFFGGEKLVWLKNANFLADDRTGSSQTTLDAVQRLSDLLVKGLPDGTRFLLSAGAVDKRRSFYKTLGKVAEVQLHDRLDNTRQGWEEAAGLLVTERARARGLALDEEAQEVFTMFTGGDRRTIENELDKLDLYLGPERREVTGDDVRLNTPSSRAGIIFELGNAIAVRELRRALDLLKQLIFQGENEVGILLATIIPTVRSLLLAKDLMARHKLTRPANPFFFGKTLERLPPEAIAHLPRTKEGKLNAFALGIAAQNVHRYQLDELEAALKSCLDINVSLVSAPTDAEVLLGQLLVRIIAK
jgi:DNA polymerase-3 subunit delta